MKTGDTRNEHQIVQNATLKMYMWIKNQDKIAYIG